MNHPLLFKPSRAAGLIALESFLERVPQYESRRNFVTASLSEVSLLSPYIRLRLISEEEVIAAVLSRHSFQAAEKFIQEVCWRSYWRNWLELNSGIWSGYQGLLVQSKEKEDPLVREAIEGASAIPMLNCWVEELKRRGYLHNHIRMYFASIWIHTLKLPWAVGAEFFMQHLYDGDPASNTLSWRWVAGLHTVGKTYLATAKNIEFHTGDRFKAGGVSLATTPAVVDDCAPECGEEQIASAPIKYSDTPHLFVVSDEELSLETVIPTTTLARSRVVFVPTEVSVAPQVKAFRVAALNDAVTRLTTAGATVAVFSEAATSDNLVGVPPEPSCVVYLPAVGAARSSVLRAVHGLFAGKTSIQFTRHSWDFTAQFPRASGFFPYWNHMRKVLQRRYAGSLA